MADITPIARIETPFAEKFGVPRQSGVAACPGRIVFEPPYRDRCPVFLGDDFTDEAGMSKARELGGHGLHVAEVFGGDPANVRAWLVQGAQRLDGHAASAIMGAVP